MLARLFLRRRVVYPALAVFSLQTIAPDLSLAQQRNEPAPRSGQELAEAAPPPTYEEAKKELERLLAAAETARQAIDRTRFDPAARAAAIGPKVEDLFRFVRDQIAYHPYRGVLRFAEGTLMSRAGNSCDKSLLLAALLRHHRYKVRFARATLPDRQAEALVRLADLPPAAATRSTLGAETRAMFADLLKRAGVAAADVAEAEREDDKYFAAFGAALATGTDHSATELADILKRAGIDFSGKAATDAAVLLAAARDHCWVQVEREGRWIDLDPSAYRIKPGDRLAEPASVSDALAPDLAFKLRFVVTVEKGEGGKVEQIVVLDHTTPLLAAVNAVSVRFTPENAAKDNTVGFAAPGEFRKFTVAWPIVTVNGKAVPGDPFDLNGRKLARDARQRFSDTIGRGFGGALGGAAASELRRVTLGLTLSGPGGLERKFERELVRRAAGPKEKAELNLRQQLLGSIDLAATGSRIDEAYLSSALLERLTAAQPLLEHLLKVEHKLAKPGQIDRKAFVGPGGTGEALHYLFLRSNLLEAHAAVAAPTVIAFAAEPQLVAYRRKVEPGVEDRPRVGEGYDVIVNALRAFDDPFRNKGAPAASASFQFDQGVVDTLLEYMLVGGGEAINVHSVLAAVQARDGDAAVVLIRPGDAAALDRLEADAASKAAMKQDLERGFALVAPAKPVTLAGQPRYAWWRVHPQTGETLGRGADGQGQAYLEWLLEVASIIATSFFFCFMEEPGMWDARLNFDEATDNVLRCTVISSALGLAMLGLAVMVKRLVKVLRAAAAARGPKIPFTPKAPRPYWERPFNKGGVWDTTRPRPPGVSPSAPTAPVPPPQPPTGSWTPGRGPHGTQIVDVPWTVE